MRKAIFGGLLAVLAIVPAHAATSIILNAGNTALPSYTTAKIIQDFTTSRPSGSAFLANTTNKMGSESVKDPNKKDIRVFTAETTPSLPGLSEDYLSIGNGSTYTISFASAPIRFFSFAFRNFDNNSKVTIDYVTNPDASLSGKNALGLGSSAAIPTFGRVSYDVGLGTRIQSVTFHSGSVPLLIDSIAAAAPEPATWLMMLVGFGMVGSQLRRRKAGIVFKPA